jgi:hypothetical protein
MKNNIKTLQQKFILLTYFLIPSVSFAATQTTGIQNPLKGLNDIPSFVSSILTDVTNVGGIVAIFAFIYAGYKFVAARGNPTELESARDIFINTCIGVAVLLGARLIAAIIVGTISNLKS